MSTVKQCTAYCSSYKAIYFYCKPLMRNVFLCRGHSVYNICVYVYESACKRSGEHTTSVLLHYLQAVEQSTDCALLFLHVQTHFSYHCSQQKDRLSSWRLQLLHHLRMEEEKEAHWQWNCTDKHLSSWNWLKLIRRAGLMLVILYYRNSHIKWYKINGNKIFIFDPNWFRNA